MMTTTSMPTATVPTVTIPTTEMATARMQMPQISMMTRTHAGLSKILMMRYQSGFQELRKQSRIQEEWTPRRRKKLIDQVDIYT